MEISKNLQEKIKEFRLTYSEYKSFTDIQIISLMQESGMINLTPEQRISLFTKTQNIKNTDNINFQKADKTKIIKLKNEQVGVKSSDGKIYNFNKTLEKRVKSVEKMLQKAENANGFVGSAWNWAKNVTGIGSSSDKVRNFISNEKALLETFNSDKKARPKVFKELTGAEYNSKNLEKFIKGELKLKSQIALQEYKEGQDMAVDIAGDVVSGIAAVGIYTLAVAAAPFSGGTSIAVGIAAAAASGAAIKTGLKYADAKSGGQEYTLSNAGHDIATGAFSGVLAPVTGGMGGAVGKTVATKIGVQAIKEGVAQGVIQTVETGVKTGIKESAKIMLKNPMGYKYIGGNFAKRGLAMGAEMVTDGALGGAIDNSFRTALDGGGLEEVGIAAVEGFVGGAVLAPVIGGGMKGMGKLGKKLGTNKYHYGLDYYIKHFPKEVEELTKFKTPKGEPRFSGEDIVELAYFYTQKPDKIKELAAITFNGEPRFCGREIHDLIANGDYDIELIKKFANIVTDEGKPRFSGYDIRYIVASYKNFNNMEEIEKIISVKMDGKYRFDGVDVFYLSCVYSKFEKEINELASMKIGDKYRFGTNEIQNIISEGQGLETEITKLISLTVDGKPRFSNGFQLTKLAEVYKNFPKEVEKLLNMKIDGKYVFGDENAIFCALKYYQKMPKEFEEVLNMKLDGKLIFDQYSVQYTGVLEGYRDFPDLFKTLANTKVNGKFFYEDYDIGLILEKNRSYPKEIEYLLSQKTNGKPRFNSYDIQNLVDVLNVNPEFVKKLLSLKRVTGQYLFNTKDFCKFENIARYNSDEINILLNNKDFPKHLLKEMLDKDVFGYTKWINRPIDSLSKAEKREFLSDLLANKNIEISKDLAKFFPSIPKTEEEYASVMKKLAQSLNISFEQLPTEKCVQFESGLKELERSLAEMDLSELKTIDLNFSHQEFISKVQKLLDKLPKVEQYKVKEMFGFDIKNGKLLGYPDNVGKDFDAAEISSSGTKRVAKQIKDIIEDYKNNNVITIKSNPELEKILQDISTVLPELYNQIDGSEISAAMLKTIQKIVKNPKFAGLSDSDRKVLMAASLLHNTDKLQGNTTNAAFDGYFMVKKCGFTDDEAAKLYSIIQSSDVIEKFMSTNKNKIVKDLRGLVLSTTERKNTFDRIAFDLKEGNSFELAQMLYSAKDKDGLTRYFDTMLAKRIREIKSSDFVLPQTPSEIYAQKAVERQFKGHNVKVLNSSDIDEFYAFIHTPEASFASGEQSRNVKFANFEAFSSMTDDKIICTSYIGTDGICGAGAHGFIFDVSNQKQFVGMGYDIFSLCKNVNDMLTEYFYESGVSAQRGRGLKFYHRTMISDNLKKILGISDDEYIKRLDNIKLKLGNQRMTLEKLSEIDPEFSHAYKEFLSRDNSRGQRNADALLRNGGWNEVLVSNPKITAIFTKNLDELPEEYLVKAEKENLPIVVLK